MRVQLRLPDRDFNLIVDVSRVPCVGELIVVSDLGPDRYNLEGCECIVYKVEKVLHFITREGVVNRGQCTAKIKLSVSTEWDD